MKLSLGTKIIALLVLFISIYFVYLYLADSKYKQGFNQISKGDSAQQIIELTGEPSYKLIGSNYEVIDLPSLKSYGKDKCISEFLYKVNYSPIPSLWSYCFDSQSKLIQKYHWVSW